MRGDWTVTPAVTANRTMDVVHRAVGKKGVILVGEGAPTRVGGLLAAERKKTERVAHGVPIYEFQVGSGEGQIPVSKLQRSIVKIPGTPQAARGHRPELPPQGAAADHAGAQGADAEGRAPAQDAPPALGGYVALGLDPDDDRVGGAVVQAAQVAVGQAGRDDEEQQQRCAAPPT